METKYLNEEIINNLFVFAEDEKMDLELINVNDMFKPCLIEYYVEEVENW